MKISERFSLFGLTTRTAIGLMLQAQCWRERRGVASRRSENIAAASSRHLTRYLIYKHEKFLSSLLWFFSFPSFTTLVTISNSFIVCLCLILYFFRVSRACFPRSSEAIILCLHMCLWRKRDEREKQCEGSLGSQKQHPGSAREKCFPLLWRPFFAFNKINKDDRVGGASRAQAVFHEANRWGKMRANVLISFHSTIAEITRKIVAFVGKKDFLKKVLVRIFWWKWRRKSSFELQISTLKFVELTSLWKNL